MVKHAKKAPIAEANVKSAQDMREMLDGKRGQGARHGQESARMRDARTHRKRAAVFSLVIACVLFITLAGAVVIHHLVANDYPNYAQPFTGWLPDSIGAGCLIMAAASAVIALGFYLFFTRFNRFNWSLDARRPLRLLPLEFTRRDIVKAAVVVFVLWLPIIVIMYPTGLTVDTFNQLYQYQTTPPVYYYTLGEEVPAHFIDHHPVFDTLLYGLFWQMGDALGSQNAGLFALVMVQSIVLAVEMGALVCYLARINVPYPLRMLSLVFVAVFPFFGHYAATILKDTTYLTFFIPWMLMWVELARTHGRALDKPWFVIAFMLLGGFCVLSKKMGAFVLAPCLVLLVFLAERRRTKAALTGIVTLGVFCVLVPAIAFPLLNVAPGGKQEVIGPAIQHVTALALEDEDALSEQERADVNAVFNLDYAMKAYEPFRTDGAKSSFHPEATSEQIARFLQIWAAKGLEHPMTYITSTMETAGMLYIPYLKMTYYNGEDLSWRAAQYAEIDENFSVDVGQPQELIELNDRLEFDSIECAISDLPIISLFFTEGFFGSWVPFIAFMVTLFARRNARRHAEASGETPPFYIGALMPIVFCCLFLIVSPVASPRYVLPMMFCTPLLFGWAWYAMRNA